MDTKEWFQEKRLEIESLINRYGWQEMSSFKVTETFSHKYDPKLIWHIEVGLSKRDEQDGE